MAAKKYSKKKTPAKKTAKPASKKKYTRRKEKFSLKKFLFKWLFIFGIWAVCFTAIMVAYYIHDLPNISKLNEESKEPTIHLLGYDGTSIGRIGKNIRHDATYEQYPEHLIAAVLATEDRRFFSHFGIDLFGLARAFWVNYRAGRVVQGGSTITQQLAKIAFLTHDRTIKRKIQEAFLALALEEKFSKEEILSMYLSRVYLGAGFYGMPAAARGYFNKALGDLNLYESAMLAGLIKAPSRYSPVNNTKLTKKRTQQVLINMVNFGVLESAEIPPAQESIMYVIAEQPKTSWSGSYFTDWLKEHISDYVSGYEGDLFIKTTLDPKAQEIAQNTLEKYIDIYGKEHNLSQGAVIIMSPDGAIRAMVGGKSYKSSQFNRAVNAYRQPGSAFKLFVYMSAFERGYIPDSILEDRPVSISGWNPENWNNKYVGKVSLREAFSQSINTIAVQLAHDVGVKAVRENAYELGLSSTEPIKDLSMALGTTEVSPIELTAAYAHLANYGRAVWTYGIESVENIDKNIYQRISSQKNRVISPKVVAYMNDLMINVIKSGTGRKADIGEPAAGKTGTSQDFRDAWFVGYNSEYVMGVWLGNDDNSPMKRVGGGGLPAIIWADIMKEITKDVNLQTIPTTERAVLKGKSKDSSFWGNLFGSKSNSKYENPN
ncbi:PBP1A family penicillin-binding protein [Rickettsiales bacterium]|nr:PBP1A family penicillin-binding protein [Rickettsiales bacterium]